MSAHTPGPWKVCDDRETVIAMNGMRVAAADGDTVSEIEANAQAIATLPKLLEALQALVEALSEQVVNPHAHLVVRKAWDRAEAVIAAIEKKDEKDSITTTEKSK